MAAGVPIVTTLIGAEGLDLRHGEEVAIAETSAALSVATINLLSDEQAARGLAIAARARVVGEFAWDRIAEELSTVLG
jgi:glycosyltransferase involved in cell wall biosynthesis